MSAVFVHVGQAGCQLAQSIWPALAAERCASPDLFYLGAGGPPRPRAVLVDAEPKAVRPMLYSSGGGKQCVSNYAFDPDMITLGQSGRGGNFALGYAGGNRGPLPVATAADSCPELVSQAVERVRRQVERCHGAHLGTVVFHSLGGGTGSGLGTRIIEELRDVIPKSPLISVSVLPMSTGENPMQSLNSLLSLAALQDLTDGVVLYENDRLLSTAERMHSSKDERLSTDAGAGSGSPVTFRSGVSLASMNGIVAQDLVPFFSPSQSTHPFDLGEVLSGMCPMPTHRFAQAFSGEVKLAALGGGHPTNTSEFRPLVEALARNTPRVPRNSCQVLAAQSIIRGVAVPDLCALRKDIVDRLGGQTPWQPFSVDLLAHAAPMRSAAPSSVRISALVNWKQVGLVLDGIIEQAEKKLAKRAFAHWYERYGFGHEAFAHACDTLKEVVGNYDAA